MPLTNIYFKVHLNKQGLQSPSWLASVWLSCNKCGGTKVLLTAFFLYILKDLVPSTKLLAADGGGKHCDTVRGRVEWRVRDRNWGLGEECMCTIEIEIRLFMEKSYGNPA